MPAGRYFSVYLVANDHYVPEVIYEPGTHKLPEDTKYLGVGERIRLMKADDPKELVLINSLQDAFVIKANCADPFPENNAFWSITVYGNDGYMKHENSIVNNRNVKFNDDGTFTVHFGPKEGCGDVPNRVDRASGKPLS